MKDLIDFPMTIEHLKQDFPNFDFSRDLQTQTKFQHLEPIISWLERKGITIELKEQTLTPTGKIKSFYGIIDGNDKLHTPVYGNKISVWKSAIFLSFNYLENRYLQNWI